MTVHDKVIKFGKLFCAPERTVFLRLSYRFQGIKMVSSHIMTSVTSLRGVSAILGYMHGENSKTTAQNVLNLDILE